eukprot:TRINITY_DN3727_c0_g1_i1.p1 TRINITY_DN3727_c0_g1~~TRINITY_DN3727_c0_g1_i1.p1  ORF type:complete len:737 (-),score=172.51 TRINITY_DN3727_c0_g1_i1:251-2242(-)
MTFGSYFIYDIPGSMGSGAVCQYPKSPNECVNSTAAGDPLPFIITEITDQCKPFNTSQGCHSFSSNCTWIEAYNNSGDVACRSVFLHDLTLDSCSGACWEAGESNFSGMVPFMPTTFAVMSGSRCFCGDDIPKNHLYPNASSCEQKRCTGDDKSWCGGEDAAAVRTMSCPIQTLQMWFEADDKPYSSAMNLALYSAYSYPNTILCLFGGMLIDRIGLRFAAILFSLFICSGQLLFVFGVRMHQWPVMMAGRVLFGLGGESLTVAQSAYTARWFSSTPLMALAFGITLSFTRIGSAVAFTVTPLISRDVSVPVAMWVGAIACFGSLLFILCLALVDTAGSRRDLVSKSSADDGFSFFQVCRLPLPHWLLTLVCLLFYVSVLCFNSLGTNYIAERWGTDLATAAGFVAVYTYVSAGASPFVGFMVDRVGFSLVWMLGACVLCVGTYVTMLSTTVVPPYICMAVIGLSLTMISATLWAGVPLVVTEESLLGTAYGVMTAVQNAGLATIPLIIGIIRDMKTPAFEKNPLLPYNICIFILMGFAAAASLVIIVLMLYDARKLGGILNSSSADRMRRLTAVSGGDTRRSAAILRSQAAIRSSSRYAVSAAAIPRASALSTPALDEQSGIPALTSSGVFRDPKASSLKRTPAETGGFEDEEAAEHRPLLQ